MLLVLSWIAGDRRRVWFRRQALWVPIAKADGAGSGFRGGFRRFGGGGSATVRGPHGDRLAFEVKGPPRLCAPLGPPGPGGGRGARRGS